MAIFSRFYFSILSQTSCICCLFVTVVVLFPKAFATQEMILNIGSISIRLAYGLSTWISV